MVLAGAIFSLLGSLFFLLSSIGLIRMPDAYSRMQTGTKATTLGALFFLTGLLLAHHEIISVPKIIGLIIFILFTNPLAGHVLSRAAHYAGVKASKRTIIDLLAEDERREAENDT